MIALSDYYFCRRVPAEKATASGIALPDRAIEAATTYQVLAAGPGRVRDDGTLSDMQAAVGDAVIVQRWDFQELRVGEDGEPEGFVTDRALVAVRRLDYAWAELEPTNDWVMIRPDAVKTQEERPSGVVVVRMSVGGGEMRLERRAEEVVRELRRLADSERFQAEPEYYQHKLIHDVLDGCTPDEVNAVKRHLERGGAKDWERMRPLFVRPRASAGKVIATGPNAQIGYGRWFFYGKGPRVRWGRCRQVDLGGYVFIRAGDLDAVDVPGWVFSMVDDCDETPYPCVHCGRMVRMGKRDAVVPDNYTDEQWRSGKWHVENQRWRCRGGCNAAAEPAVAEAQEACAVA